jgi:hypothetical protein
MGGDRAGHAVAGGLGLRSRTMTHEIPGERRSHEQRENGRAVARKPYQTPLVAKGPALAAVTAGIALVSGQAPAVT